MSQIRIATIADVQTISRIHARSWKSAYIGLVSEQYLDNIPEDHWVPLFTENMQTRRFETALFFEGKEATACITYGKPKDESIQDYAEIVALYVLPRYWSQRQGYELMIFSMMKLKERGFKQAFLWVFKGNKRAIQFYEKLGFTSDGLTIEVPLEDEILDGIRYSIELR